MADASALKMDQIYRFQRHVYDATRAYYLLGRDQLIEELDAQAFSATVLEVACGTGRNLIKAADRYPSARFFGFDVSEKMLETAQSSVTRRGLSQRITLANGDATQFDPQSLFGVAQFDRIFISYALSMIPAWEAAVREALCHLAPGGRLLIVDFGEFSQFPKMFGALQAAWLGQFSVKPIPDLDAELSSVAKACGCAYEGREVYRGYSVIARISA